MKTIHIPFFVLFLSACSVQTNSGHLTDRSGEPQQQTVAAHSVARSSERITEPFTHYLGDLHFSSGARYRVVTQFKTVQTATGQRGRSSVTIRDTLGRIVRTYRPDMPEQLPTGVIHNKLVFHFENKRYLLPLEEKLPVLLCIPLNQGCY